ncbi:CDP-diacylglycerol--glycerol-3-phosphate 3-phosphatidyltransferase [Nanoarchaeota archaeon]
MKLPNVLTFIRFVLIPVIIWLLYTTKPTNILLSMFFLVIAFVTDVADGYIAKNWKGQKSVFGTFFDPLVDKMLMLGLYFTFVDLDIIPLWLVLLVLARELIVTGVRQVCSKPKKIVGANWMGKSKFGMQVLNIVHLHLVLYFGLKGVQSLFFSVQVAFWVTFFVTLVSLVYAGNFLRWYRKEILSDI